MCLISNFKFITVNFSLRSVPLYECCVSIFIIQLAQAIETLYYNQYCTYWQDLNFKMFSIYLKPQNTIQQNRKHSEVVRFNMIQGPITACHFKRSNCEDFISKQQLQTTFQQIILERTRFKLGNSRCKQRQ